MHADGTISVSVLGQWILILYVFQITDRDGTSHRNKSYSSNAKVLILQALSKHR